MSRQRLIMKERHAGLIVCLLLAAGCAVFYVYAIGPYVMLRADILMWGETEFVGSIIKLRTGAPLYGPPAHSNSYVYTPGAPVVTFALLSPLGLTGSIPALRIAQLGYVVLASLLGVLCVKKLRRVAFPHWRLPHGPTWFVFASVLLFLAATSPQVNRNAHCLHTDALALLASVFCFWTLVTYVLRPSWPRLGLMILAVVAGFLVKQLLLSWAGAMLLTLILQHRRAVLRPIGFALAAGAAYAVTAGLCYALWGDDFLFWTYRIMGGSRKGLSLTDPQNIALLRSADHALRAWMELMVGMVGGWLVLRASPRRRDVSALWVGWIALVAVEVFVSGVGWATLYYLGPGVMVGTMWFLAGVQALWYGQRADESDAEAPRGWAAAGSVLTGGVLVVSALVALRVVPTRDETAVRHWPPRRPPEATYTHIAEIEQEFEGEDSNRVLLDVGNWVYLPHDVLMRDRGVPLGDQPSANIHENFDVLIRRIEERVYEKILVHDLDGRACLYEWFSWDPPSGVRAALREHYREVRTIGGLGQEAQEEPQIMFCGPVSVLVPRDQPAQPALGGVPEANSTAR